MSDKDMREVGGDGAMEGEGLPLVRSAVARWVLIGVGSVSVGLGFLGVFLPLLPTTPFLLLAAASYARASPRFYRWLLSNRWFGEYIRDWRAGRGVPRQAKVAAVVLIGVTIGGAILFVVPLLWVKVALGVVGVSVSVFLVRLPTRPRVG